MITMDRAITPSELYVRRHAALVEADSHAGDIEALGRRIEAGTQKIAEATLNGAPVAALDAADLKLAGLRDELYQERMRYEVPAEILDAFYSLATSLAKKGLPENAYISAVIPGFLNVCVSVDDADEPPF